MSQVDTVTRIISLAEALTESPLWIALIGGDDAVPALHTTPLPELIPGRAALHLADGSSSLTTLAMSQGTPISDLRAGCLAALVLGQMELRQVGVAVIQRVTVLIKALSERCDRSVRATTSPSSGSLSVHRQSKCTEPLRA